MRGMSLQNVVDKVRKDCEKVLAEHRLSQQEFAEKHGLSYSWLNKVLNGELEDLNPRVKSVDRLRDAITAEKRAS